MIIITGATGQLGKLVAQKLLDRVPAAQVGVSVRDPQKADWLSQRGVRVRSGDFADGESLRHAFEGASQVLIVSTGTVGEITQRLHRTAIEAAQSAGAQRILYTSHMGANPESLFSPMREHAATEATLKSSGIAFTSLHNGFYAASAVQIMGKAFETGKLIAPEDGLVCWTTHADLAEAAAIALTDSEQLNGVTPPLSGSEALSLADLAAIASEATGRSIAYTSVTDQEYRTELISQGAPEWRADLLIGMFKAMRRGEFATVDPTLERLLERKLVSMREYLSAHIAKADRTHAV
jgi:NAD(P)H dehydrogenase (quinone)